MNIHPTWYYTNYDKVFGTRNYDQEIAWIDNLHSIKDKEVLEIGAGTGNHARIILDYEPFRVHLIDLDPTSIEFLKQRFAEEQIITISNSDGFKVHSIKYDYIICLYSIVQQAKSSDVVIKRILNIYTSLKDEGVAILEFIDFQRHFEIFEDGKNTLLRKTTSDTIFIKSEELENHFNIVYSGNLNSIDINYKVSLVKINLDILHSNLKSHNIRHELNYFEKDRRRVFLKIKKPAANTV